MPLTPTRHKIPDYTREAFTERKLMEAYHERPDFQRNDYIGWIMRAKCEDTKQKRLAQMLEGLADGKLYMKMKWKKGKHARKYAILLV